uniref:Uncharacterized protein n=1 Tax=Oryza brachyantha TaxID=4533 RepID=J3KXL3_ORYBR
MATVAVDVGVDAVGALISEYDGLALELVAFSIAVVVLRYAAVLYANHLFDSLSELQAAWHPSQLVLSTFSCSVPRHFDTAQTGGLCANPQNESAEPETEGGKLGRGCTIHCFSLRKRSDFDREKVNIWGQVQKKGVLTLTFSIKSLHIAQDCECFSYYCSTSNMPYRPLFVWLI